MPKPERGVSSLAGRLFLPTVRPKNLMILFVRSPCRVASGNRVVLRVVVHFVLHVGGCDAIHLKNRWLVILTVLDILVRVCNV